MKTMNRRASLIAAALVATPAFAGGQWTVHYLPLPQGVEGGNVTSIDNGIPAGVVPGLRIAVWRGLSVEPETLVETSFLLGSGDGQFVGQRDFAAHIFGGLNGPVSLHPAGASASVATDTDGGIQVGEAFVAGRSRAALWRGTAESYVDLMPPGALGSGAYGIDGGIQVGSVLFQDPVREERAALWQGTAESWRSLHPIGVGGSSIAFAVHRGVQVGRVNGCAALWRGTPESWVNLTPNSTEWSEANSVFNGYQVGKIGSRATLWRGTAESREDLSAALDPSVFVSSASCVWVDSTTIYVGGLISYKPGGFIKPVVWTRPICRADFNGDGMIDIDDFWVFLTEYAKGCE